MITDSVLAALNHTDPLCISPLEVEHQIIRNLPVRIAVPGAHHNKAQCLQMSADVVIKFAASSVRGIALNIILSEQFRAVGLQVSGFTLQPRRKDSRMKHRACKLAIHYQLLQHSLSMASKADNHTLEVILAPAIRRKIHVLPRRTDADQCTRSKGSLIIDIDIAIAIAFPGHLKHWHQNILRTGKCNACILSRDPCLFQLILQSKCVEQILVSVRIQRKNGNLSFSDMQPSHYVFFAGHSGRARNHGHSLTVQITDQRGRGILCYIDNGTILFAQAVFSKCDAVLIDSVNQNQMPAPRQDES